MTDKTKIFLDKLNQRYNNEYEVLGEYQTQNTKIKVKHSICHQEFEITPKQFLAKRSKGCNYCRINNRTKTHEAFVQEVDSLVGDEYVVLSQYVKSSQKLKMKHCKCETEYEVTPSKFLCGRRCPKCAGKNKRTNAEWVNEVQQLSNNEYTVIGEYVNNRTKIMMKHNVCNHEWLISPSNFKKGHRCPICATKKVAEQLSLPKEEFLTRFRALNEPDYELITYQKFSKKMTVKHLKCGNIYDVLPNGFLVHGNRCPKCKVTSIGETNINQWLLTNNIHYKREYWFDDLRGKKRKPLRFDFAILDNDHNIKCLIEYDGRQHFVHEETSMITEQAFKNTQKNDKRKNKYCKNKNITLFRIGYTYQQHINEILNKVILEEDSETIQKFAVHIAD